MQLKREAKISTVIRLDCLIHKRGGRVVGWCWVNFQCRSVLPIWIRVEQGSTAIAVDAVGGCLDIFSSLSFLFSFSLSLGDGSI